MRERLAREEGTLRGAGRRAVALVYPAAYPVGMASLGYQTLYRTLNHLPDTVAERSFLPDDDDRPPLLTYESERPVADFGVVAFSIAWELELGGLFSCLRAAGLPPLARDRDERHPWVVVGGPLTAVNPRPLSPFADVVVVGEAEPVVEPLLDALFSAGSRHDVLAELARVRGVYVPSIHGEQVPATARCDDADLPAYAAIWTGESALPNMFLVEAERGCSRACTFCVMRRADCGMRVVSRERVLATIPDNAPRVGLVGAAVSDHPELDAILAALVESGREVGLSSLRADRLTPARVELLARAGYRTLTVAADGASERLREQLHKRIHEHHLATTVELARDHGLERVKIYAMVGVPEETDADLDELCATAERLAESAGATRLTLAVSPFVPKPGTPLGAAPFVGVREIERRLKRLRRLEPRVRVPPASARWAWVEWVLAQGGAAAGEAALCAHQEGGSFAAWKRALLPLEPRPEGGNVG